MSTTIQNHRQQNWIVNHLNMSRPTNKIIQFLPLNLQISIYSIQSRFLKFLKQIRRHLNIKLSKLRISSSSGSNFNPRRLKRRISILKRTNQSHILKPFQSRRTRQCKHTRLSGIFRFRHRKLL